jgi:HEAT repeat protein
MLRNGCILIAYLMISSAFAFAQVPASSQASVADAPSPSPADAGGIVLSVGVNDANSAPAPADANGPADGIEELIARFGNKCHPPYSIGGSSLRLSSSKDSAQSARQWDHWFASSEDKWPELKELRRRGPEAAVVCNRALTLASVEDSRTAALAVVLGYVGNKESIPILIDGLSRAARSESQSALEVSIACTWALWRLTGRKLCKDAEGWKAWWQAVEPAFLPPGERAKARVTAEQVMSIARRLKEKDDELDRERLMILGPPAVPHMLKALAEAEGDHRYRLAWAIDEMGCAAQMPADVRREYFTRRLVTESRTGSISDEAPFARAFAQQSLADFFRTAIDVDRQLAAQGKYPQVWAWLHTGGGTFKEQLKLKENKDQLPRAVDVIVAGMADSDPAVRKTAVQIAATIGFTSDARPAELLAALEKQWLAEADENLRYDVGFAFSRFDCPELTRALVRELDSNRPEILGDCVNIIGWHGPSRLKGPEADAVNRRLAELVADNVDRVRRGAVRGLQSRAPRLLEPHLKRLCDDPQRDVREFCIFAMQAMKDPRHTDLLVDLATKEAPPLRDHVFSALSDPAFRGAIARLAPYLRDPQTMYMAQWAIVAEGGPEAVIALIEQCAEGNTVGETIWQALDRLTGKKFKSCQEALAWWWSCPPVRPTAQGSAIDPNSPPKLWAKLRLGLTVEAYQAAGRLADAGDAAAAMIAQKLRPVHVDTSRIKALIDKLGSPEFKVRHEASAELAVMGGAATAALTEALRGEASLEARSRMEQLLKGAQSTYPASAEAFQAFWAVFALEWMDTPRSRSLLNSLAGGTPGVYLADLAKASLSRLKAHPRTQPATGQRSLHEDPARPLGKLRASHATGALNEEQRQIRPFSLPKTPLEVSFIQGAARARTL